jgi:hypothetical protein
MVAGDSLDCADTEYQLGNGVGVPHLLATLASNEQYLSLSALHSAYHLAIASLDDMVAVRLPSSGFADFREGLLMTCFSAVNCDVLSAPRSPIVQRTRDLHHRCNVARFWGRSIREELH